MRLSKKRELKDLDRLRMDDCVFSDLFLLDKGRLPVTFKTKDVLVFKHKGPKFAFFGNLTS